MHKQGLVPESVVVVVVDVVGDGDVNEGRLTKTGPRIANVMPERCRAVGVAGAQGGRTVRDSTAGRR